MEEKLLKLFKLADLLNDRQKNVYAEIEYSANNIKQLSISIRSKKNFLYIKKCKVELSNDSLLELNDVITLFENYVRGIINE